jgi:Fe-S-cluster containining protein
LQRGSEGAFEVDLTELSGRSYRCIENCALCCLCQPELLPDEEAKFRADPRLAEGVTDRHLSSEVKGAALKLRGAHGSCWFLAGRRCRIYGERPHFCRAFPVSVFVGWRVQLNANLSCRGIGLPGERLDDVGRGLLDEYGSERLKAELKVAGKVFSDFVKNCRDAWVSQSFSSLREAGRMLGDELVDSIGLSRALTYAENGRTAQNASARDIVKHIRRTEPEADIEERALIDGTELFDLHDLSLLPIYLDENLTWKIFKLVGKEIVCYELAEDGGTKEVSRTDPGDIELLPMDRGAREAMKEYLRTVNSRDCFLGHAAYLCDSENYDYNLAQVYVGALANNALDLMWRASFLARLKGRDSLGPAEIREGVVFFDMDLLDLPTIGAFI